MLKGAIRASMNIAIMSPIFVVPKSTGGMRLILDLREVNKFLIAPHFKLEEYLHDKGCVKTLLLYDTTRHERCLSHGEDSRPITEVSRFSNGRATVTATRHSHSDCQ